METHSGATTDRRIMSDLLTAYKTHTAALWEFFISSQYNLSIRYQQTARAMYTDFKTYGLLIPRYTTP